MTLSLPPASLAASTSARAAFSGSPAMVLDQEPDIRSGHLVGKPVGTEQERDRLRECEGMDLNKVRIVGRVRRTSKISVHLVSARVAHGGIFAELLVVFQFADGRVVSRDLFNASRSESIEPRVADVADGNLVALDQCECSHARHSGPLRIARCGLEDLRAGQRECFLYALVACARCGGRVAWR